MITIENPNPEDHLHTEWLLTNGLGGYAMGTVLGVNTRRYHGLLVAATNPPLGRIVALHSMIEQLVIPRDDGTEEIFDLSTQMFMGPDGEPMLHPDGWRWLKSFRSFGDGPVEWSFDMRGVRIERSVSIASNSVRIQYTIHGDLDGELRIRPLTPLRDFHGVCQSDTVNLLIESAERSATAKTCGVEIFMSASDGAWVTDPQSWRALQYPDERERGLEDCENVSSAGYFVVPASRAADDVIGVFVGVKHPRSAHDSMRRVAKTERLTLFDRTRSDAALGDVVEASFSYVVRRAEDPESSTSIIAGYPWFADWGRDAMISLPGLLLCTGRFDEARSLLESFASHMRHGLIPNCFHDAHCEAMYNTVDASLWFIHAVREWWKAVNEVNGGAGIAPVLLNACREVIRAYRNGTDFDIRMDPDDGLIIAGDSSEPLTWMDAFRGGVMFTPRDGKPVEIQALWFNALHCVAAMTDDAREADDIRTLASRVAASVQAQFWWSERNCMHDVLRSSDDRTWRPDGKLRPNQIFAVSLPHSPLKPEQQRAIVDCVRDRLLTPFGLRTLDPDDPGYIGRFEGDLMQRDAAYHNGTVWPWLIGPCCEAVLRVNDFSEGAKMEVREILQPLLDEMRRTSGRTCLGQIAEVYDGDAPQRPAGCPAQAWSVAEVLRVTTLSR